MICRDCSAGADYEALPGLAKVVYSLSAAATGYDRCRERNRQIEGGQLPDCMCQHRVPKPRWMRHFDVSAGTQEVKS
jgi:hypothetical protein